MRKSVINIEAGKKYPIDIEHGSVQLFGIPPEAESFVLRCKGLEQPTLEFSYNGYGTPIDRRREILAIERNFGTYLSYYVK